MKPWAPWADERWVALMTNDSGAWLRASWRSRCLFALLIRIVGRGDGRVVLDGDARGAGMFDLQARLFAENENLLDPLDELVERKLVRVDGCAIEIVAWADGSDLPTGGYVRNYTRDTAAWIGLSVWARGVWCLLLRSASRDGIHFLGASGMNGLARLIRAPLVELQPVLDELLGVAGSDLIEHDVDARELRIVAYRDAQETTASDAARKRAERERARSGAMKPTSSVTSSHALSRPVTPCPTTSRAVTPGHSDLSDPNQSDPNISETTTTRPDKLSRAGVVEVAESGSRPPEDAPSPPTSPSPSVAHKQASPPVRGRLAFNWASTEEQSAGETVVAGIQLAGAGAGETRGPLASIATPQVARMLLGYTSPEVCGCAGKLELADVIHGINAIGQSEAARLLGPGELPKTTGELSRYIRGGVSNRKRGDAKKDAEAQGTATEPLSAANLELAREATRWAWKQANPYAPGRIVDSADDAPLAKIWCIAQREAEANPKWKDLKPNDIQRIIAHWLSKYFRGAERAVVDAGYPLSWLLSSGSSRIKGYGLPDKRSAPNVKPTGEQPPTPPEPIPPRSPTAAVFDPVSAEATRAGAGGLLATISSVPVASMPTRPKH